MPCSSEGYPLPQVIIDSERENLIEQIKFHKDKADQATRLLCSVLGELLEHDPLSKITDPELSEWWEAHKKFDEKRK